MDKEQWDMMNLKNKVDRSEWLEEAKRIWVEEHGFDIMDFDKDHYLRQYFGSWDKACHTPSEAIGLELQDYLGFGDC